MDRPIKNKEERRTKESVLMCECHHCILLAHLVLHCLLTFILNHGIRYFIFFFTTSHVSFLQAHSHIHSHTHTHTHTHKHTHTQLPLTLITVFFISMPTTSFDVINLFLYLVHLSSGQAIVVGMGKKNPNAQKGRERRGKSKKQA